MRRRTFITLISGAGLSGRVGVRSLTAWAQDRIRRVGILVPLPATDPVFRRNMEAFTAAMKNAGWIEGRNLEIKVVSIIGSGKTPGAAAKDAIALSADVLIAVTPVAADALHKETSAVPVVFVVGWINPVAAGFVTAINRPAGNMTGITDLEPSLGGKWVQLLKQIAPEIRRVGIVYNPDEGTISAPLLETLKEGARRIAVDVVDLPIRNEAEIENVIAAFTNKPNGGLISPSDIFTAAHRAQIIAATNRHRVPAIFPYRYFALDGGLAAYSPDQPSEFRQAAYFVDRILRGEKPETSRSKRQISSSSLSTSRPQTPLVSPSLQQCSPSPMS
ncbi:MAG TPA: ABC transporter substrate-binding protein [Xanthobacteraceae bacterium]